MGGILGIVALVAELAPKIIAAGGSVISLWNAASDILKGAEANGGKVDPDAFDKLKALVQEQLDKLHKNAEEARQQP